MEKEYPYNSKMLYNPNDRDLVKKLSVFGEFALSDEVYGMKRERLFPFIVLVFDLHSPLRQMFGDIWQRYRYTMELVGVKRSRKGYFSPEVEEVLEGKNVYVNACITKYVMLHGIPEYTALVAYQVGLQLEMMKVLKGVVTPNITKNIEMMRQNIRELTEYIFGGDVAVGLKQKLYSDIEKDRFPLPDEVVKRISSGDKLDDYNPYGDYKVDEMKFLGDE